MITLALEGNRWFIVESVCLSQFCLDYSFENSADDEIFFQIIIKSSFRYDSENIGKQYRIDSEYIADA